MNTQFLKWTRGFALLVGFCLGAAMGTQAQQQQQRPGGAGGFGGFGGQGGGANRSTANSSGSQYNPAGAVGNAIISVDPDTHNVTIIADEETTRYISTVITNLDRPQPQVLIKVVFVEVTHNDATDIGVEGGWMHGLSGSMTSIVANSFGLSALSSAAGSNGPLGNVFGQPIQSFQAIAPFAVPGAGLYQVLGSDFQATLRAIAQAGKAELLSRPSILARNNQPATIVVGQSVPLITDVRFDTFGNAINSVTYQNVGIILKVTPFITGDGLVQMIVAPQTSSIDQTITIPISSGVNAPVINVRSADTVVLTPDGQTVVIGGMMQRAKTSSNTKIPILGDIPVIGTFFKRRTSANVKTELLIFLTPHVIQAPSQLASLADYERKHSLVPKSYSEEELDKLLDRLPAKQSGKGSSVPARSRN